MMADSALYVYDRICTRSSKQDQLAKRFGEGYRERQADYRNRRIHEMRAKVRTNPSGDDEGVQTPNMRAAGYDKPFRKLINDFMSAIYATDDTYDARAAEERESIRHAAISHKKAQDLRNSAVIAVVLVAATLIFVLLSYAMFFGISEIKVTGDNSGEVLSVVTDVCGINEGDGILSVSADEISDTVTFRLPSVKSVTVTRSFPAEVSIEAVRDEAVYYADIWGDTVFLSSNLRVLGSGSDYDTSGLTRLILPAVKSSVAGRALVFDNSKCGRTVRAVLDEISASELSMRLAVINVSDITNMKATADGCYEVRFGDDSDLETKLAVAEAVIESGSIRYDYAKIDVKQATKAYTGQIDENSLEK